MMLNTEATDTESPRSMEPSGLNLNIYSSTSVKRPVLLSVKTAPVVSTPASKGKDTVDLVDSEDFRIPDLKICEKVDDLFLGNDHNMILIFDLTTSGSLVSSSAAYSGMSNSKTPENDKEANNGAKKAKDVYRIHLSLPSTLVKRPKFHFEKLLQTVIDDSKRLKLLNLIDNCNKFLFFDGVSTLKACSLTTYWLIKKFKAFLHDKLCKSKIDLCVLERMDIPPDNAVKNVANNLPFEDNFAADGKTPQKKISLTVKVLPRSSEKMFIQSIKKDTIHYSPTSLKKFFKFKIPQNLSDNDSILPNWLKPFGHLEESDSLLQKLLSNFEFLENLELKRLERGLTVEHQQSQIQQSKQQPQVLRERELQKSNSYQKIYSLSSLQREFKNQRKSSYNTDSTKVKGKGKSSSCPPSPCHEISDLKLSIPKENGQQGSNLPTISVVPPKNLIPTTSCDSSTSPISSPHADTDSDSLLTPMNHYEMSEGIKSFAKNRYSNILPYEHSRVKLQPSPLCGPPSINQDSYSPSSNENAKLQSTSNTSTAPKTTSKVASTSQEDARCSTNLKKRRNSTSISPNSSPSSPVSYFNQSTARIEPKEGKGEAESRENFNDYFNANYLRLPQVNPDFEYIATQAPLPSTIDDFWKVISTNGVKVIISLNSNDELFMRKWDIYWNNNRSNQKYKIDMMESFENVCGVDGCILRIFSFYKSSSANSNANGETNGKPNGKENDDVEGKEGANVDCKAGDFESNKLTVYQLQYTKWLDSCGIVMKDILNLYTIKNMLLNSPDGLIKDLRSNNTKDMSVYHQDLWSNDFKKGINSIKQPPLLVHCSAGCGRTGVFITLDFLLNVLTYPTNSNNKIDVWNMSQDLIFITVNELRKQRISMVQNLTQYITCYESILEYFSLKKDKFQDENEKCGK